MSPDQLFGNEHPEVFVGEHLHRVELVRGPETIEEVHEGHPGRKGRCMRHRCHVVCLLDRGRREHCESGLADAHHVRVVTEDRQGLCGDRPSCHMEHSRSQLAGDLVHVRDHEQKALGRSEGRAEGAALK